MGQRNRQWDMVCTSAEGRQTEPSEDRYSVLVHGEFEGKNGPSNGLENLTADSREKHPREGKPVASCLVGAEN